MTRSSPRITVLARAKINLDLRIGARRPDGYNEVRTIYQALALADRVTVELSRGRFELVGDRERMPLDRANLVWRAAEALWRASGRRGAVRGVRVTVLKRIPAQAGLGGGSSDAAAALMALDRLWGLGLGPAGLRPIAASLGSDVPFFLVGGTAIGMGRGEQVYPLIDLPPMAVVLVFPGFGVSTREAYGWFTADGRRPAPLAGRLATGWPGGPLDMANDLEPPVARRHPEVAAIRRALEQAGATVGMLAGSGSAVWGLFGRQTVAERAAARLGRDGWLAAVTRTIGRPRRLPAGHSIV